MEFLDSNYQGVHHSENLYIKYHEQKICEHLLSQGSIEEHYLSKNVKIQFWGINENINVSTELQY